MPVKYKGDGSFMTGVPARDMDDDEWAKVPKEDRQAALKLGLYEVSKPDTSKGEK